MVIHRENVGITSSTELWGNPPIHPLVINRVSVLLDAYLLAHRFELLAEVSVFLHLA